MEELRHRLKLFLQKNREKGPTGWAVEIGIRHATLFDFIYSRSKSRRRTLELIEKFLEGK